MDRLGKRRGVDFDISGEEVGRGRIRAWIFRFLPAPAEGEFSPGDFPKKIARTLLFAGSSRRSGCVPAEPYPPLEQREYFPFPFPVGCIGRASWEWGAKGEGSAGREAD